MSAADPTAEGEILDAQEKVRQALVRGDANALAGLWGDEFASVTVTGAVWPRGRALEELRNGDVEYLSLEYDQIVVRVYGDSAIVTGRVHAQGVWKQRAFTPTPSRFTHVFVKRDGAWRLVAQHLTKVAAP
jgi:uncharacterized protein (TIGR02246 family)